MINKTLVNDQPRESPPAKESGAVDYSRLSRQNDNTTGTSCSQDF
jgi:hypothetical protein